MKMVKIFIFIYFLFVLSAHVVHTRSTEVNSYKNSFYDVDEGDETERKLIENNQEYDAVDNDEDSMEDMEDDDDSLIVDAEPETELILNEELMKLSLDSFKALKEAVYEIDEKIDVNEKSKRETHLQKAKRKFKDNDEDEEDNFEEIDEQVHKDNKRHDGCHCSKNCESRNQDEGIIEKKIHSKINKLKDSSKMDKKRFLGYSKQSIRRNKRSASTDVSLNDSKQELNNKKEDLDKIREQYLESFPKDEGIKASISTFRKSDQFLQRVKRDN